MGNPLSIYIHWPFCASKCPYCDFNSRPIASDLDQDVWKEAYLRELSFYAAQFSDREIHTIYFGGGTPSLMKPSVIAGILDKIAALWSVQQNCEITIEANPTSSEKEKFQAFKTAGVNRLSLGVQALNDVDLRFLGRQHDANAAREVLDFTSKTFDRYSFDLIYARAGQAPAAWCSELREALSFGAQHMSLYQLTIEERTVFAKRARHETLCADDEAAVEMFVQTQAIMEEAGLHAYEISNHAVAGQESRHNLTYWNYGEYLGVGPGAHGRFIRDGIRHACENIWQPYGWLENVISQNHGQKIVESLALHTAMKEAVMMGLRLREGLSFADWNDKFDLGLLTFLSESRIQSLCGEGLLNLTVTHVSATAEGRQKLNALLGWLLPD